MLPRQVRGRLKMAFAPGFLRQLHSITVAPSFCCKGSLSLFNKESGEDAYFYRKWIVPGPLQGVALLGVADGVGGWRKYQIDCSKLSNGVAGELLERFDRLEGDDELPQIEDMLKSVFLNLQRQGDVYAGGTTLNFGLFDPETAVLKVGNIGDSECVVFRKGQVVQYTERDTVGLAPKQLVILPTFLLDPKAVQSWQDQQPSPGDLPPWFQPPLKDLKVSEFYLQHGDIVVFGTDGLYDNMYTSSLCTDIAKILVANGSWIETDEEAKYEVAGRVFGAEEIAELIVKRAYYNSLDPNFMSPYATRAFELGDDVNPGGKPDDITVVVGIVNAVHN